MNKKFMLDRIISGMIIELNTFIFSEVPRI